jgi:hypothetical protein
MHTIPFLDSYHKGVILLSRKFELSFPEAERRWPSQRSDIMSGKEKCDEFLHLLIKTAFELLLAWRPPVYSRLSRYS